MKTLIGIDPGLDGAIAAIRETGGAVVFDVKTLKIGATKRDYDIPSMVTCLMELSHGYEAIVALELVHAFPGQGVTSTCCLCRGLGIWQGILGTLQLPTVMVSPQRWKSAMMDGQPKEKQASILTAVRLFPQLAEELTRKKDHNRSDALLMAAWLKRQDGGR